MQFSDCIFLYYTDFMFSDILKKRKTKKASSSFSTVQYFFTGVSYLLNHALIIYNQITFLSPLNKPTQ